MIRAILVILMLAVLQMPALAGDDWQLVFSDDFSEAQPGEDWVAVSGEIKIIDGALELRSTGIGIAMIKRPYPGDVKVVYTAWTPQGVQRCDLTTVIGANSKGTLNGYFFGYGSWMDTKNHILKDYGVELDVSTDYLIGANDRKHNIEAVRDGNHVHLTVDGKRILEATDRDPCNGDGEDHIAFYTWCSAMCIDDLKIYVKGEAPKRPSESELKLPVASDGTGKLVCDVESVPPEITKAIELYNSGRMDDAFAALSDLPDSFLKASAMAWIVGNVDFVQDRAGTRALLACLDSLPDAEKSLPQAKTLSLLAYRLSVLAGVHKGSFSHFVPKLLAAITPDHPFYDKTRLYEARIIAWAAKESGNHGVDPRVVEILKPVAERHPDNRILRIYLGEDVPWEGQVDCLDSRAPEWAIQLCESYQRAISVIEWWGKNRQEPNGSVGDGWGNDVELLRTWGLIAMISDGNENVQNIVRRMADGVWYSDQVRGLGYDLHQNDVQHSAEPTADTQPLMMYLNYGDPEYVERNLVSARLIRDKLMGRNSYGHWHWRSNQLSANGPSDNPKYAVDVPYACRPFKHITSLVWYSQNPGAVKMLKDWAGSWAEDTMRAGNGKPAGVVPASVAFADDNLSGTSDRWTEPDLGWGYYNWRSGSWMYDIFALALAYTGDESFLEPINAAMNFKDIAGPDVEQWVIDQMGGAASTARDSLRLYQMITGDTRFDSILKGNGNEYEQFIESGERASALATIANARKSIDVNYEMLTSEVIATDRAGISCAEQLLTYYCGTPKMWEDRRVPLMSVRWGSPTDRFAAVVTATSAREFQAVLYSFENKALFMSAQLFRLEPGIYEFTIGPDSDDDWKMDRAQETRRVTIVHRGDSVDFHLPARRGWIVRLRQVEALPANRGPLPDLAIAPRDIERTADGMRVTVHNIGGADAGAFTVKAVDSLGTVLAEQRVRSLKCPADLRRKVVTVELPLRPGTLVAQVTVQYSGPEIIKSNNTVADFE